MLRRLRENGPVVLVPAAWTLATLGHAGAVETRTVFVAHLVMDAVLLAFAALSWSDMAEGTLRVWRTVLVVGLGVTLAGYGRFIGDSALVVAAATLALGGALAGCAGDGGTTTAGAEPDLQVVDNIGLGAFELPLAAGTTVSDTTSARADRTTGQDWPATTEATAVRWTDPGDTPLNWGTTYRFSIVTDTAPARTTVYLVPSGETTPLVTGLLGPEPADLLFANDFEPPATR